MGLSFRIPASYFEVATKNAGKISVPAFIVPLRISSLNESPLISRPIDFLYDTGASFCTIDRKLAADRRIHFDEDLDRVKGGMGGLGGVQDAWLATVRLLFPEMTADQRWFGLMAPQTIDFEFRFKVLVVEELDLPLLGTGDMLRNFTVTSKWEDCHFQLNADHLGTPIAEGATP